MTDREIIKEVMTRFNEYRDKWIAKFGSDKGFDEWFTAQMFEGK